ncbi:MAG TPA: class I SAM-dependent methyltransferase [Epsilonproteobacteria bacterium]|nr:class I SAM-dependent methyltransferase [Campylobacterota bacterium]
MIPFNHLGWIFKTFGSRVYPKEVRHGLCKFLNVLDSRAKVLDVGAGTGMMCEFAQACRDDLLLSAVDPAPGMLKFSPTYVTAHEASAEALPFDDNHFDCILMGEALHHFREVDLALEQAVRVLKDTGKLFIYDFNIQTWMGKIICHGEKLLGEPGNFFEPEVLKTKLETYGFSVKIKHYAWRYTISAVLEKK